MKALKRLALATVLAPVALFGLTACGSHGPMEEAGEDIDEAIDDIGDAFDD